MKTQNALGLGFFQETGTEPCKAPLRSFENSAGIPARPS